MSKKILIIRFSSIGDIVLTSPVVRCIKKQLPDVELHYLTKIDHRPLIEANPYIDKHWYLDEKLNDILPALRNENFDEIIDLHNNLRSLFIKLNLKKPYHAVNKMNFRKWLKVNLKVNVLPDKHIIDRYLETTHHLGVKNDGEGMDHFIPAKDEVKKDSLPRTHQQGYIGFVIGARHETKKLPVHKMIELCELINFPIVILGDNNDRETGKKIEEVSGEKIYNACGLYNINQSASIVKNAKRVISHDTGLMHIAAAFQKEIAVIWGNTIPDFGMYPYFGSTESLHLNAEVNGLSCRPCSKIGYAKCPRGHFKCMENQEIGQIAKWINQAG